MRRIDLYFITEMTVPAIVGFMIMLMLLLGRQLYALLLILYRCSATGHDIVWMLLYYLPTVMMLAVPACLLLGTSLSLNRLERDRELQALRMAGVSLMRLVLPMIMVGVIFSIGMFVFQEKVIPITSHRAELIKRRLAFGSPALFVPQDVVMKLEDNSYLYVRRIDPKTQTFYGVILLKQNPGRFPTLLTVPMAEDHDGQWFLQADPTAPQIKPRLYTFSEHGELSAEGVAGPGSWINMTKEVWAYINDAPTTADELTIKQLLDLRHGLRGAGTGIDLNMALDPEMLTFYLHLKFSSALAALVAVLIAIPLSVHFGRSGGYVGLLLSVMVAFFFIVSQQWAQVLAETSHLSPIIAAWAPDVIFGLLGLILLIREEMGIRRKA